MRPSKTRTSGGAPGPAPAIRSGNPSPLTSPSATRTPPVNSGGSARKSDRTAPAGSYTRTRGSNPKSAPTATSRSGSAGTSGATGRTPGTGSAVTTGRSSDMAANPAACTNRSPATTGRIPNAPPSADAIAVTDSSRPRESACTSWPLTYTPTDPPDFATCTVSAEPSLPAGW